MTNRFEDAAATFATPGRYAVPQPEAAEPHHASRRSARTTAHPSHDSGSEAVAPRGSTLRRRRTRALLGGVIADDRNLAIATFVASVRINTDGLLDRYLGFACAKPRDPIPTDFCTQRRHRPTRRKVVHHYFRDLDAGRFVEAAAHFSDDVVYSHPPYQHTGIDDPNRIEFRGHEALHPAFECTWQGELRYTVFDLHPARSPLPLRGCDGRSPRWRHRQLHLEPVVGRR